MTTDSPRERRFLIVSPLHSLADQKSKNGPAMIPGRGAPTARVLRKSVPQAGLGSDAQCMRSYPYNSRTTTDIAAQFAFLEKKIHTSSRPWHASAAFVEHQQTTTSFLQRT